MIGLRACHEVGADKAQRRTRRSERGPHQAVETGEGAEPSEK